jgi:DDE domain
MWAARRFFEQAICTTRVTPSEVMTDLAPTYPVVLDELLPAAWHRTDRYANNHIEADHGRLKSRLRPMRGLKRDRSAKVIIAGHALVQNVRRGATSWQSRSRRPGGWRSPSTSSPWRSEAQPAGTHKVAVVLQRQPGRAQAIDQAGAAQRLRRLLLARPMAAGAGRDADQGKAAGVGHAATSRILNNTGKASILMTDCRQAPARSGMDGTVGLLRSFAGVRGVAGRC